MAYPSILGVEKAVKCGGLGCPILGRNWTVAHFKNLLSLSCGRDALPKRLRYMARPRPFVARDLQFLITLMQDYELRQLDQRTIALEVSIASRRCILKGTGRFEPRGEFGPSLRVDVKDPTGNFEVVLKQDEWTGRIHTGEEFGCDFAVQLDASCLCTH